MTIIPTSPGHDTRTRKTRLMLDVERRHGLPLEVLLPRLINEISEGETARFLGVKRGTLGYWLLKLGIRMERVVLAPGEEVVIRS